MCLLCLRWLGVFLDMRRKMLILTMEFMVFWADGLGFVCLRSFCLGLG